MLKSRAKCLTHIVGRLSFMDQYTSQLGIHAKRSNVVVERVVATPDIMEKEPHESHIVSMCERALSPMFRL